MNEKELFGKIKTIAVIGCSTNPAKIAHLIPGYMQRQGYKIIPINPNATQILGQDCFHSLSEAAKKNQIDLVNVFRPSAEIEGIVQQVIDLGLKSIWVQEGITSEKGKALAEKNKIFYIENKCIMKENIKVRKEIQKLKRIKKNKQD